MQLNKINLLFASANNYKVWENQKDNLKQTLVDLNIMDVIAYLKAIDSDFQEQYLIKPCVNIDDANYRLEIMEELVNNKMLCNELAHFSSNVKIFNEKIMEFTNESKDLQKQYRYLRIVCEYFQYNNNLATLLTEVKSKGLKTLFNYCTTIKASDELVKLSQNGLTLLDEIHKMLSNNILIIEPSLKYFAIDKGNFEDNESEQLKNLFENTFGIEIENFYSIFDPAPLSNMEEKILFVLKNNNKQIFYDLNDFYNKTINLLPDIIDFSELYQQLSFYLTYISLLENVKKDCMSICKPTFNKNFYYALDSTCPSLITKCLDKNIPLTSIVANNINLSQGKMFILSGPNQGGKTIYLKTVGQNAYLAKCGCFVFSKTFQVPFYDLILTHFNHNEVLGKGRLIEEIERVEHFFPIITNKSLILLNESFTSTRRKDGVQISMHYIHKFKDIGCSLGFVSHYYEIPDLFTDKDYITQLVSGIDSNNKRTYKISESSGTKMAYAKDIAYKCGMTYDQIVSEIKGEHDERN